MASLLNEACKCRCDWIVGCCLNVGNVVIMMVIMIVVIVGGNDNYDGNKNYLYHGNYSNNGGDVSNDGIDDGSKDIFRDDSNDVP